MDDCGLVSECNSLSRCCSLSLSILLAIDLVLVRKRLGSAGLCGCLLSLASVLALLLLPLTASRVEAEAFPSLWDGQAQKSGTPSYDHRHLV
ncbi:hypothetical protein GOODEAATRI_031832, partial [Goodea atripinnis]